MIDFACLGKYVLDSIASRITLMNAASNTNQRKPDALPSRWKMPVFKKSNNQLMVSALMACSVPLRAYNDNKMKSTK